MKYSRVSFGVLGLLVGAWGVSGCGDDPNQAAPSCESGDCAGAPAQPAAGNGGSTGSGASSNQGGEAAAGNVAGAGAEAPVGGNGAAGANTGAGGESSSEGGTGSAEGGTGSAEGGTQSDAGSGGEAGAQSLIKLELGQSCEGGTFCESGYCVDGVCCESACAGTCDSCLGEDTAELDGQCGPIGKGNDPQAECGNYTCSGQSACTIGCETGTDCASGIVCKQGSCVPGKRMFVTSTTYAANFDELTVADAACNARATAAGLTGTFKAWISNSSTSAASRLTHSTLPYYRMDGAVARLIANDWADLVDGVLVANATDEFGEIQGYVPAFTGTEWDGSATSNNCLNWGSSSAEETFAAGNSSAGGGQTGGANWSHWWDNQCSSQAHFFCIEQ